MKKKIVIISILIGIILLNIILFGLVFCLRKQQVKIEGEAIEVSSEQIIETANLKNGKSIFALDKEKAINNIELKYPDLKVIQIKTISVIEIQIVVRKRYETYFVENNSKFYILDEDLKVLSIEETVPTELIKINATLGISKETKVCDFVGTAFEKDALNNLFFGLYTVVKISDPEGESYLERDELHLVAESVSFNKGVTLTEEYNRLIIKTPEGVELDIGKPNQDLQRKINICYSAMKSAGIDETKGTIKIYYSAEGEEKIGYFEEEVIE